MIDSKTGKVVGYSVMSRTCRTCNYNKSKSCEKDDDCRQNWSGSSKTMEPAMAVNIIRNIESKGHKVRTLVIDDDTSTICKIRSEVNPEIKKCSDKNHYFRNFTNHLFTLQKEKYKRILRTKIINHIKNVVHMLFHPNLIGIPHHLFGDHSQCNYTWCLYLQNRYPYVPKNLPYGKYLSNKEHHHDLVKLFTLYAEHCDKLYSLESTQNNESFNQIVESKNQFLLWFREYQ